MKKSAIRVICALLAMLVVALSLPLNSLAAEAPTLYLEEQAWAYCSGGAYEYRFNVSDTGMYVFESFSEYDTYVFVFDKNRNLVGSDDVGGEGGNFKLTVELEANRYYYVKLGCYDKQDYSFTVTKPQIANELVICDINGNFVGDTIYGYEGRFKNYTVSFLPEGTVGKEVEWISDDTHTASVSATGEISFNNAGVTTVTAKSGDLQKAVTVCVDYVTDMTEYMGVEFGETIVENVPHDCYSFTSKMDTQYCFYYSNLAGVEVAFYDSYGDRIEADNYNGKSVFYIENGKTVYVEVNYNGSYGERFNLKVEEAVFTESVDILLERNGQTYSNDGYNSYVGETVNFLYSRYPENSISYSDFEFTSSDSDVVSIEPDGRAVMNSTGAVAIRLTNHSGISDRVTLHIYEPKTVDISTELQYVSLSDYEMGIYKGIFTASTTSWHKVTVQAPYSLNIEIIGEDDDTYLNQGCPAGQEISFDFEAIENRRYIFKITTDTITKGAYAYFSVCDFVPLQGVYIVDKNGNSIRDYYCNTNEYLDVSYSIVPENADADDLRWWVEDENVLSVEGDRIRAIGAGVSKLYFGNEDIDFFTTVHVQDVEELYLNGICSVTYNIQEYGKLKKLTFKPSWDGYYSLRIYGNDTKLYAQMYDEAEDEYIYAEAWNEEGEGHLKGDFYLEGNKTYIISFYGNEIAEGSKYEVAALDYSVPTSVNIVNNNGYILNDTTLYLGEELGVEYHFSADNCYLEDAVWKSSDEEVAVVNGGRYGATIIPLKEGIAEITVTTAKSKLSATIKIRVSKGDPISLDTPTSVNFSHNGTNEIRYIYTATETGLYKIGATGENNNNVYLSFTVLCEDVEQDVAANSSAWQVFKMIEGKTYIIKIANGGMDGLHTFTLTNLGLSLDTEREISIPENTYFDMCSFVPEQNGYYKIKVYTDAPLTTPLPMYFYLEDSYNTTISGSSFENGEMFIETSLQAGEAYKIGFDKYNPEALNFKVIITKELGIDELKILKAPDLKAVYEGHFNFDMRGLVLEVKTADGQVRTWQYEQSPDRIFGFNIQQSIEEISETQINCVLSAGGATVKIPFEVRKPLALEYSEPLDVALDGNNYCYTIINFTPQNSGYYLFKTYNHTNYSGYEMYMNLQSPDEYLSDSTEYENGIEMSSYLEAGVNYWIRIYKHFYETDSFEILVEETIGVTELTVNKYPDNMTVYEDSYYDFSISGLELNVTTSNGVTGLWKYDENPSNILGFGYNHYTSPYPDENKLVVTIQVGGCKLELDYQIVEYPLKKIEVITGKPITVIQNTNGSIGPNNNYIYNFPQFEPYSIKLTYNDGTYRFARVSDYVDGEYISVTHNQLTKPWTELGTYSFTVRYRGKTAEFPVTIVENDLEYIKRVDDTVLTAVEGMGRYEFGPLGYYWHYDFDTSDLLFEIKFKGEEPIIACIGDEIKGNLIYLNGWQGENPILPGKENSVTVEYNGREIEIPVTVLENNIKNVTVTKTPEAPYIYGDSSYGYYYDGYYDLYPQMSHGFEFTVEYDDGTTQLVTANDVEYGKYNGGFVTLRMNGEVTVGPNIGYIAYGGVLAPFTVEVQESPVSSIEVLALPEIPEGLEYYPDMVGLSLKLNYTDGANKTVTFTEDNIQYLHYGDTAYAVELDGSILIVENYGNGNFVINYKGYEYEFIIENANCPEFGALKLEKLDVENKIAVFSYTDYGNKLMPIKTVTIDLSTAESEIFDDNGWFEGVYKSDKGVFTYWISFYFNGMGECGYYCELLGTGCDNEVYDKPDVEAFGDINGDGVEDVRDLVRMKKLLAKTEQESEKPADFDGDGAVTATDAASLRKSLLGMQILSTVTGDINGDGVVDNYDSFTLAMFIAGSDEMLSTRADVNLDGVIDILDKELLNTLF